MKILPSSNIKGQRATWWLCLLVWCQPLLIGYIIIAINKIIGIPFDVFYDFILPAIYIILTLIALPHIVKRLKVNDMLFYFGVMAVYGVSYFLFRENREYLSTLATLLPFSLLPMYFLGVSFELEPLKRQFLVISIISIISQLLFFRFFLSTGMVEKYATGEADHYMTLSYQILPYVLYVIWHAYEEPKVLIISFAILGGFLLLILGTRGPFASFVFFTVFYLVVFKLFHVAMYKKVFIVLVGVIMYVSFTSIVSELSDLVSSTSGSTRILGWIMGTDKNSQASSDVRVEIAELAISKLRESNYMGLGFAGDRAFMGGFFVHNFILECLVSYGILGGTFVLLFVFYRLIKGILRNIYSDKCKFLLLLICLGMIPLLVSGSYVDEPWFYLMLGYCTQVLRTPKVNYLNG